MKKKLFPISFFLFFSIILFFLVSCTSEGPSLPATTSPDPPNDLLGSTATTYTVTATAGEHGSITPSGEITVPIGESITLKIIPDMYYKIDEVFVNGVSDGAIDTLILTVTSGTANYTVHASFAGKQQAIIQGKAGIYETISSALNVAESGDVVVVYPGIYYENLLLDGKNITLKSCNPSNPDIVSDTIIDGGGEDVVIEFTEDDTSTLEGLTIQNGNDINGGGIYIYMSSPTIKNNIITSNTSTIDGGGIYMEYSSSTITNNTIIGNKSNLGYGGGISINLGSPTISGNTINQNAAVAGGGVYLNYSSSIITNNVIMNNIIINNASPIGKGGGIYIMKYKASPVIGGENSGDTANFNHVAGNYPDQIIPDSYPYNNIGYYY